MSSDSAGVPWEGRAFDDNAFSGDDGSAPAGLIEALTRFRSGSGSAAEVVDEFRRSRLLIPLVARLGESGVSDAGLTVDKSAELAIVTVAGPDGRTVMPVFSSVAAMAGWNPSARPVPADAVRVALAAASEATDLVVLDPTAETEFVIRRPAVWAIAQSRPWTPSFLDPEVAGALREVVAGEAAVVGVSTTSGDPTATLRGAELAVEVRLIAGLGPAEVASVVARLQAGWAASAVIAERVDSLAVRLATS